MKKFNSVLVFVVLHVIGVVCSLENLYLDGHEVFAYMRRQELVELFERRVAEDRSYENLVGYGLALWRMQDRFGAVQAFVDAINTSTTMRKEALIHGGDLLAEFGIPDLAENNYRLALGVNSTDPITKVKLARVILEDNPKEALNLLQSALRMMPDEILNGNLTESVYDLRYSPFSASFQMASRCWYTWRALHDDISYTWLLSGLFQDAVKKISIQCSEGPHFVSSQQTCPFEPIGRLQDSSRDTFSVPYDTLFDENDAMQSLNAVSQAVDCLLKPGSLSQQKNCFVPRRPFIPPKPRDLVIAFATNIRPLWLNVFVSSFRSVNEGSRMVLFMDRNSWSSDKRADRIAADYAHRLTEYNNVEVEWIDMSEWLSPALDNVHVTSSRFVIMAKWLRQHQDEFDRVLAMDARDATFQADPFATYFAGYETDRDVLFVAPELVESVRDCDWNEQKVKDCFPNSPTLLDATVVNSGTIMGNTRALLSALDAIATLAPTCGNKHEDGHDQASLIAAFNAATNETLRDSLHRDGVRIPPLLGELVQVDYFGPEVLTIGHETRLYRFIRDDLSSFLTREDDTIFLNTEGKLPSIIHQYDRHPRLIFGLRARYPFSVSLEELYFSEASCDLIPRDECGTK